MSETTSNDRFPNQTWQNELAAAFTNAEELFAFLELNPMYLPQAIKASKTFPLRVTGSYASRIKKGDLHDPLLRQILPLAEELDEIPGYKRDPVGDINARIAPGILKKYRQRALIITNGACAINCRYCFRREFPYRSDQLNKNKENLTLDYIAQDQSLEEIILSGGDPLILKNSRLASLIQKIASVSHIKFLRIHTRIPIVLPSRIDSELIDCISQTRLKAVIVVHTNHPNELSQEVQTAISNLIKAGISLFNQSVLLKGVNDNSKVLIALSKALFNIGVIPYYVHLLDKTTGTAHFEVSEQKALRLLKSMRESLPGYLVPQFVREQAGASYKIPL